ncbi:hypothetical protein ACIO93_21645 [Streptomyces sp. NPDC087903]|uniref:hypothetical protein n=1 Tax=Streptomyces sp. NPDC087903 TaxID=3365819 RepID=UPI00380D8A90
MGALRRIWRRPRGRRVAGAAVFAVVVVGGAAACDPNGLSSASVAFTTDQTATKRLERQDVNVRWLTCTASYDRNGSNSSAPSATENTVAAVDCKGETDGGQDITVTGKVTRAVNGACVRGDLTAKVGGRVRFHVDGLGNCDATTAPRVNNPGQGATATVTVTRTIWCQTDPQCRPVEGK